MGGHILLSALCPFKPLLAVRVKVIFKGKTEVRSMFQKTELIVGDEKGNTMQATFSGDLDSSTEIPMEEGHCYEINNFSLNHTSERVWLTKNRYHIKLSNSSLILKIDPIPRSNFYCFPNFLDVYRGFVNPKFSIDIYGAVVGVGFLEEYMTEPTAGNNGFIDHRIRFFVVKMDNVVIKCVAYGKLAHVLQDLWNSTDANVVLCVLQFWQLNWGKGNVML
ncbi:hypothetical protein Bca4012_083364 [Brassica carinata]